MVKRMYAAYVQDRAVQLVTLLGFIFGFSVALLAYIASTYFKEVIDSDNVSVFYIITFLVILVALFKLNRIIEGFGRARTLMTLLAIQVAVLFLLQFTAISWLGAFLVMVYYVMYGIISVVFDIILEAYSQDNATGRVRGAYLSVWNFGFIIGPICSMYLLDQYGFNGVFVATMLLYVLMFLITFIALNDIRGHVQRKNYSTKKTFKAFKKNINLVHAYWISFTLRFFYAVMTIYIPLHLREIGLAWSEIGIIFSIMLIPFVLVQYPAGILADKKFGEKEMLFIGTVIMIGAVTVMYFFQESTFVFWATFLFISRIGAALVEAMLDSYFYKQINENDISLINFLRSTRATAYIASAVIVGVILLIYPHMNSIFIVLFISLSVGLLPIILMRDTEPCCE